MSIEQRLERQLYKTKPGSLLADFFRFSDTASFILLFWLMEPVWLTGTRFVLVRFGLDEGYLREAILFAVASLPLIWFLVRIKKFEFKQYRFALIIIGLAILSYVITYFIHPEYDYFFFREDYGLLRVFRPDCAIFAVLFFSLVEDPKKLWDVVFKYAWVNFFYLMIVSFIPYLLRGYWVGIGQEGEELHLSYDLTFGYTIIFPLFVFYIAFYREKRKIRRLYLAISIFCFILALLYGSRGAALLIMVFAIVFYIHRIQEAEKSKRPKMIVKLIVVSALFAAFGNDLLSLLRELLAALGLESRTLEVVAEGGAANPNGRFYMWGLLLDAIKEGSIFGYGAMGDRPFIFPFHYAAFSHNIIMEMIVSFGIIGVIILLILIVQFFRMSFCCKDVILRDLFLVYFIIACQLMTSMSFWYVAEFWVALALAHKYFTKLRERGEDRLWKYPKRKEQINGGE